MFVPMVLLQMEHVIHLHAVIKLAFNAVLILLCVKPVLLDSSSAELDVYVAQAPISI